MKSEAFLLPSYFISFFPKKRFNEQQVLHKLPKRRGASAQIAKTAGRECTNCQNGWVRVSPLTNAPKGCRLVFQNPIPQKRLTFSKPNAGCNFLQNIVGGVGINLLIR